MFTKTTLYLVIVCIILGVALSISIKSCNKNKKQIRTIKEISTQIVHDTITRYKDDYGIKHAQTSVISGNKSELNVFYKEKFDSLCKQYNIQSKQLDEFIKIQLSDTGSFIVNLFTADSFVKTFSFEDKYIGINGVVTDSNVRCNYSIDVPLDIGVFWRRKHHFWFIKYGKKVYRVDASSPNPNVFVENLLNIKINKDL